MSLGVTHPVHRVWPFRPAINSLGQSTQYNDPAGGASASRCGNVNAALRDPYNADIQNYLGYAYRRLRRLDLAFVHYRRALMLNPRHRGAREHLGEAYLMAGDLALAEAQLQALKRTCLIPCDEHGDLERAIAIHRIRTGIESNE